MDYINPTFLLLWAAALCAITAAIHSVLGEQKLIGPLLASDASIMQSGFAGQLTRFAWHWTTLLWLCVAATLAFAAYGSIDAPNLLLGIGIVHVGAGLADAVLTRGRHIGWPLITIIGLLTIVAHFAAAA